MSGVGEAGDSGGRWLSLPFRVPIPTSEMVTLSNAQRVPASGWYEDQGGDRLYLREGDLAPICPRHGLSLTRWRLVIPLADTRRDRH